jgi:hypothetical protein
MMARGGRSVFRSESPDALELVLLLVHHPRLFRRAALRWHARYRAAASGVGFEASNAVLACVAGLAGRRPKPAPAALAEIVRRRGLERASEILKSVARRLTEARAAGRRPSSCDSLIADQSAGPALRGAGA